MPYSAEISRKNPSCMVFVVDQSGSMDELFDGTQQKCAGVAHALNRLLYELGLKCANNDGIRNFYDVGVIGYGNDVHSAFAGSLAGQSLIPIGVIAENPIRIETGTKVVDDGSGKKIEKRIKIPIWFEPVADGGTPMNEAIGQAARLVRDWLGAHPSAFPPVVIHITDGESTDGDPTTSMRNLTQLSTSDGNVLLFNLHISGVSGVKPVSFPNAPADLPDDNSRMLFRNSSQLTPFMRSIAAQKGFNLSDGARGFVLNADLGLVVQALDIGTKAANLR